VSDETLPKYVLPKRLARGRVGYYWSPNKRLLPPDCPLKRAVLGEDLPKAIRKADALTKQLDHWHAHGVLPGKPSRLGKASPQKTEFRPGTFDHMLQIYREANPHKKGSYAKLSPGARDDFDYQSKKVADHMLHDPDERVGDQPVADFDPPFVDALYNELVVGAGGRIRRRSANLMMASCRRAWNVAARARPELVPMANPFARMGLDHTAEETIHATYAQLLAFEDKAAELGMPVVAFVARAAFDLLQRVEEVCETFAWAHWRPLDHPNEVFVGMEKTGAKVWKPVLAKDEETGEVIQFYPELEARLHACPRLGDLVCMHEYRVGTPPRAGAEDKRKIKRTAYTLDYLRHQAAEVRAAAGLPDHVTLASFRHGGLTELGDGALPDSFAQALSRHKQRGTLDRYIHRTSTQLIEASKLRMAYRRKEG
jgi:hypothetical protein